LRPFSFTPEREQQICSTLELRPGTKTARGVIRRVTKVYQWALTMKERRGEDRRPRHRPKERWRQSLLIALCLIFEDVTKKPATQCHIDLYSDNPYPTSRFGRFVEIVAMQPGGILDKSIRKLRLSNSLGSPPIDERITVERLVKDAVNWVHKPRSCMDQREFEQCKKKELRRLGVTRVERLSPTERRELRERLRRWRPLRARIAAFHASSKK
jgi:hypothetical protein